MEECDSESLGLELQPGDPHYRAYVGPPEDYDLVAAMTFNLLTTIGLRQHHTLLDVGCGSLRIGRLFIPYLNQRKYLGIEPNEWLVNEGVEKEIGHDLLRIKRPRFFFSDSPQTLGQLGASVDFAVAQSIFSHCALDLIGDWLFAISGCLKPDGALLATFLSDDTDSTSSGWIYPGCVKFRTETMETVAATAGLRFEVLDWKHPRQTWALFAKPAFDASWFKEKPLSWNSSLEKPVANRAR